MKVCKHAQKVTHAGCYRPIVARNPNPVAQGGTHCREICLKCGATRLTNENAGQMETTGWKSRKEVAEIEVDLNRRGMYPAIF